MYLPPNPLKGNREKFDNVQISRKSKVESSRVSIYSEHETQNLNSKSRKLSGQILKLIPEPETRNLKIRTLTPPPSGTPLNKGEIIGLRNLMQ
jgi:hypothetical protein